MMQEFGGVESAAPGESGFKAPEQLSEAAKQRFAAAQQQIKQILKEERRARKRDDSVARTIMQFLGDKKYDHLFPLISRLAARDCPSIFILAILSLIHDPSRAAVEEYTRDNHVDIELADGTSLFAKESNLSVEAEEQLLMWISRMQLVMSIDGEKILLKLMVDESNIDGTALELMTAVLVDFFRSIGRPVPPASLRPLTMNILQTIIEPFAEKVEEHFKKLKEEQAKKKGED